MITWWTHLSFSQGAMVILLWLLAIVLLVYIFGRLFRARSLLALLPEEPPADPWPIRNYAPERQAMIDWLGEDHLLAKPVNRIGSAR